MAATVTFLVMVAVNSEGIAAGSMPFEFSAYEIESIVGELHNRIERLERVGLTSVRLQAEASRQKLLDAMSAAVEMQRMME